ncbi:MAG TPA: VOC family protein, partial [Kofleriaceae bacterium]|nr:VOC family protein [Kofleriaceae bacterium]
MTAQLNHTIVAAHDKQASASFMTDILGLPPPEPFGPFLVVHTGNGVSLDFRDVSADTAIARQHYAFLVSEGEFDEIFARLRDHDVPYWADPGGKRPQQVNTNDGGRGLYFPDPNGHWLEILTRPYGS